MPFLNLKLSEAPAPERSAAIATMLFELTSNILRKDPKLTAIAIEHTTAEHWLIGGRSLAAQNAASFFLTIRVTAGSNTADEKARYIAAVYSRMREILGGAHDVSYVHVHDVPGEEYGYGGLTQAHRRRAAAAAVQA